MTSNMDTRILKGQPAEVGRCLKTVRFPVGIRQQDCQGRTDRFSSPNKEDSDVHCPAPEDRRLRLRLSHGSHLRMRRDLQQPVTLDVRDNLLEAQDGFMRALERADSLRAEESAVAWFYRLLRNAVVDYYRRRTTEDRARNAAAMDQPEAEDDAELRETVCACVRELVETLKPEYRDALRRVELEGERVDAFAREAGITATNASVRLHRAREALRRRLLESCGTCMTHGCRACECGEPRRRERARTVARPLDGAAVDRDPSFVRQGRPRVRAKD